MGRKLGWSAVPLDVGRRRCFGTTKSGVGEHLSLDMRRWRWEGIEAGSLGIRVCSWFHAWLAVKSNRRGSSSHTGSKERMPLHVQCGGLDGRATGVDINYPWAGRGTLRTLRCELAWSGNFEGWLGLVEKRRRRDRDVKLGATTNTLLGASET